MARPAIQSRWRRTGPAGRRRLKGRLSGRSLDLDSNIGARGMIAIPAVGDRIRLTGLLALSSIELTIFELANCESVIYDVALLIKPSVNF